MRFLLDENLSAVTARLLRESGHDVDVIAMARRADRVLFTFDSDIGERLFLHGDAPPPGVVYLRFIQASDDEAARLVLSLIEDGGPITGFYTTHRSGAFRRSPIASQPG